MGKEGERNIKKYRKKEAKEIVVDNT